MGRGVPWQQRVRRQATVRTHHTRQSMARRCPRASRLGRDPYEEHHTYLNAQFWRLARRVGKKRAAVAVAHSIIVSVWHILANDVDYHDLGGDYFDQRYDTAHETRRLVRRLEALGNTVSITPTN